HLDHDIAVESADRVQAGEVLGKPDLLQDASQIEARGIGDRSPRVGGDTDHGDVEIRQPRIDSPVRQDLRQAPADVAEAEKQESHRTAIPCRASSRRSISSRRLYMQRPVRTTPPRSASPSTSIARAA